MRFAYNYVLICASVSWAAAQIIKAFLHYFKTKHFNSERLLGSGGMPSSHSSFVSSALVAVSRKSGTSSIEFAIMFIIAAVVIYDAMGVRYAAGLHAKELNRMNKYFKEIYASARYEIKLEDNNKKELKEFLGHTPYEVFGGVLLGILVAFIIPLKR